MTDPILLQFIDKVYRKNLDYCVICLRTTEERRLEKPVYLKKFIENVSNLDEQCFKFKRSHQLVCFVCERQAAAASRFLAALGLATHAHSAVHRLNESPGLRCQFHANYIQYAMNNPQPDLANIGAQESMLHLELRLRQQRMNSQLLMTEVLMVSTPCTNDNIPDPLSSDCEVTSGPGESRDMYVIPDLMPNAGGGATTFGTLEGKTESEIKVEPIVILDDDDSVALEPATLTINTEPTTLETIAPTIDEATLGSQSIGPRIVTWAPKILPQRPQVNGTRKPSPESRAGANPRENRENKSTASTIPSTSFIVHPLVFNSGMMTVPSLSANIMEGQLVTSDRHTLTVETPELVILTENNIEFISDRDKVTNILKQLSHHQASKVFIFKSISESEISSIIPEQDGNTKIIVAENSSDTNKRPDCNKVATICTVGEVRSLESEVKRDGDARGIHARESGVRDGGGRSEESRVGDGRKHAKESGVRDRRMRSEESRVRDGGMRSEESGVRDGVKGREGPQLRSDRIDWEDKIPMDVISFVDEEETMCKRPRGKNDQPPPLGISNVTSLCQDSVVIDLC